MAPILTIAIPTFNRPEQIKKQVRLILPQLVESVQLVVYDNCSVPSVASLFTENELNMFTLVRNITNVGGDSNIARCFENCNTKWLWTLSDDDWIKDSAVEFVLDQIKKKNECDFICFIGKHFNGQSLYTNNFNELCKALDTITGFSAAFTMSFCIYNMSTLKPELRHYYENLNSMIGTLILVLKYGEKNTNLKCYFSKIDLIASFDPNVGWNYLKFIRQSSMLLYALNEKNKQFYNKTIFKGLFLTHYFLLSLNRKETKASRRDRLKYLSLTIFNQGFINVIKYNFKTVIKLFITLITKE